jgi:hypothetical protein
VKPEAGKNEQAAARVRHRLLIALTTKPVQLHAIDSQLEFAHVAAAIWPCDATYKLRAMAEQARGRLIKH